MTVRLDPDATWLDPREMALVVNLRPERDVDLRITSWDDGLALVRDEGAGWVADGADPELDFFDELAPATQPTPVAAFLSSVPTEVLEIVARFRLHQLTLLRMARWCDGAIELMTSAPALAWLVAGALAEELDVARATLLLRLSRVDMLSSIVGMPMSAAEVRFLAKCEVWRWDNDQERILRRALRYPEIARWCAQERTVEPVLLPVLIRYRRFLEAPFIVGALRGRRGDAAALDELAGTAAEAHYYGLSLGHADAEKVVLACTSRRQIEALCDRWRAELDARQYEHERAYLLSCRQQPKFRAPPLVGTGAITPIDRPIDLLDEGHTMGHCAATYVDDVLVGDLYFYRVLQPERATLAITVKDGVASVVELLGAGNAEIGEATRRVVNEWLKGARGDAPEERTGVTARSPVQCCSRWKQSP